VTRKWWGKKTKIRAVHDNDLEQLLSSLGILQQIKGGRCSCLICGSPISLINLGAVLPIEEDFGFICDLPSCIAKVNSPLAEGGEAFD
jgi:hypothetical protein